MNIVNIGNWAVFVIYLVVLVKSVQIFMHAHKAHLYGMVQPVVYAFGFCLTMQAVTFMVLQVEWILEDNNDSITDVASWGWMFYDYFNGFALLCFATALDIYINWRVCNSSHNRRREDKL
jgi:hypothetical protein